ncbi:MAG: NUDIX hydrolase [Candidatus Binatia bacterium]|nr:NUDIX hydrolase [Candidatus Binatia bacterium]
MHRKAILGLLERYLDRHPNELIMVDHIRQFVRVHDDCFERTCLEGHITASAWVVSEDHQNALFTHHAKLQRWLQLGGHSDGQTDPFQVALREAREESGMQRFREASGADVPLPLDVDVHRIPERRAEPAHLHLDIRYLLIAEVGQPLVLTEESNDLRWIPVSEIAQWFDEESLLRMARKVPALLGEGSAPPPG